MSEDGLDLDTIIALEGRITAALDRIAGAAAVNAVAAQGADDAAALAEAQARADGLATELSEAQARADAVAEELATAQDGRARLEIELAAAQEGASDAQELGLLREKTERLRQERGALREERDGLAEELDMFRSASGGEPAALLKALRDLRQANAALRDRCEELRKAAVDAAGAPPPDTLDAAMAAELLSMRAERAADAAEMQLILDELRPMTEGVG